MKSLYVCYFGLREPLVQAQVLPYLRELKRDGLEITILTFEPGWPESWCDDELNEWTEKLSEDGIGWQALRYHRWPSLPATLFDVLAGVIRILRISSASRPDIVHARSHVAALMGAIAKKLIGARLIFDIRGFMPEEYVDAGVWKESGLKFRLTKWAEKWLMASADGFVVLTERARSILFPGSGDVDAKGRPVAVIPCCVDLTRFEGKSRKSSGSGSKVWAYVGGLGGWYLTDRMAEFLAYLAGKQQNTEVLVLTQSPAELLTEHLERLGFHEPGITIRKATPAEVPRYLETADIGLSFIKPCYSKLSSSPTKVAEYLAAGLPVLTNSGIGDLDALIAGERVGVILKGFDESDYREALSGIDELMKDPDLRDRCRRVAKEYFDLEAVGGERYRDLYRRIMENSDNGSRAEV